MSCGIYKIQNKINNMIYIGQSIHIEERFKEHIKYHKYRIDKDIQKYGKDNFSFDIIEICSKEKLSEREIFWIKYYNSYEGMGYNDTPGGQTNEAALKKTRKAVEQYNLKGEFIAEYISVAEAARQTGIQTSNINYCCNNHPRYRHAGNYLWKYKQSSKEILPLKNIHTTKKKNIFQIDKCGNIIQQYPSAMEAERQTGINHRHISECCKNQRKTAGGYYWKYVE